MLGVDNAVERETFDNREAQLVNFRDNLGVGVDILCEKRNNNILLVSIHQCDNRVSVLDSLGNQKLLVHSVAVDYRDITESVAEVLAPFQAALNNLYLDTDFGERLREIIRNLAAAQNHYMAALGVDNAEVLEEL